MLTPVPARKKNTSGRKRTAPDSAARPVEEPAEAPAPSAAKANWLPWLGFLLVLLVSVAWPLTHAYLVDNVTVRLCRLTDANIPPEKRMPVFLSEIAFDGYVWNRHAERLGQNGEWRVRKTDLDNAPEGREVHWNSVFAWYLRGLGELRQRFVDEPLRHSIFRMSIWANPILLVLAIVIFSTLSARRFGPFCGAILALGMVAVPTFYEGFMPAYPDHHGLIAFCLLGLLFGIAWAGAGWVRVEGAGGRKGLVESLAPDTLQKARHGMIFSAICGAASLWISALSTGLVLGAIGASILLTVMLWARPRKGATPGAVFHAELWRTWAIWGSLASLGFYLLEYFPQHMSMRLEVNHPLYALAWWGGGWTIAVLTAWWVRGDSGPWPQWREFPWKSLLLPIVAMLPLPLLIVFGGPEVYLPKDPFMGRLWKNIAELLPLLVRIQHGGLTWQVAFGWFPLVLLGAVLLQFSKQLGTATKATLLFLALPIVFMTALQFYQVRWGMLAGPLYLALAALVLPTFWRLVPPDLTSRLVAAAAMAAFGFLFVQPSLNNSFNLSWTQYRSADGQIPITPGQGLALLHRQMALAISEDAGDEPVVLLSSPNSSCLLSTLGGFRTIGTLYWENVEGLKAAAAALNAQSDQEALELLKQHGVTHISFLTWENFIEPFFHILHPRPGPTRSYGNSFGKRALFDRTIPAWSRPLIFPHNNITRGLNQQVLLLRVAPEQTPLDARVHLSRFVRIVEGNPQLANQLLDEVLQADPNHAGALAEKALFSGPSTSPQDLGPTLSSGEQHN